MAYTPRMLMDIPAPPGVPPDVWHAYVSSETARLFNEHWKDAGGKKAQDAAQAATEAMAKKLQSPAGQAKLQKRLGSPEGIASWRQSNQYSKYNSGSLNPQQTAGEGGSGAGAIQPLAPYGDTQFEFVNPFLPGGGFNGPFGPGPGQAPTQFPFAPGGNPTVPGGQGQPAPFDSGRGGPPPEGASPLQRALHAAANPLPAGSAGMTGMPAGGLPTGRGEALVAQPALPGNVPGMTPTNPADAAFNDINLADTQRGMANDQLEQYGQDVGLLRNSALGRGPSAAQSLMSAALDANRRAMASTAASARGGNIAAALRGAQQAGAQANLQSINQMSALRADEQLRAQAQLAAAQGQYAGAINAARATDVNRAGTQAQMTLNRGDLALRGALGSAGVRATAAGLAIGERDAAMLRALQAFMQQRQLASAESIAKDQNRTAIEIADINNQGSSFLDKLISGGIGLLTGGAQATLMGAVSGGSGGGNGRGGGYSYTPYQPPPPPSPSAGPAPDAFMSNETSASKY